MPRSRLSPVGCPLANKFRSLGRRSLTTAGRKQPAPRRSLARRRVILSALIGAFLLASGVPSAFPSDDHNPIGVSGVFEGMITTGCAYNALNHNARREVEDIVVPGAIGKYGLRMTRYYNSRRTFGGMGPGWTHEYSWAVLLSVGKFQYPNGNEQDSSCFAPLGVSDGWVPGSPTCDQNGCSGDFRLADGGTVHFEGSTDYFQATTIKDPYNQTTTLTYLDSGYLSRVTEPGGRYLQFTYNGPQGLLSRVEAHGLGNATVTDWVNYSYDQVDPDPAHSGAWVYCLTGVTYSDGTSASYTYTQDNAPYQPSQPCPCSLKLWPLLQTCQDVRYKGAMRQICYEYQANGPHGAIIAERYSLNRSTNGPRVSSIDPPAPSPLITAVDFPPTYTETRGDNPTRTFNYTPLHLGRPPNEETCPTLQGPAPQQFLQSYTDFKGNTTTLDYDRGNNNEKWYVKSVKDANNHTTLYERGPAPPNGIGEIKKITYPDNTHVDYIYQNESPNISGHYVTSVTEWTPTNQRRSQTVHARDANTHKISQTDYKDADLVVLARETFTYCDQADGNQCGPVNPTTGYMHGQIKTHKLKNGAYVHYRYDSGGRGLLIDQWEPTWSSTPVEAEPKTHYEYYTSGPWSDRLKKKTGPPPNWPYSSQASETYEYDRTLDANGITNLNGAAVGGRGLVTKITHADGKYQTFKYDAYGNKRWENNELHLPTTATSYIYDEYNRLTKVTRPLNGITDYTYNPTNGSGNRLSHTTSNPDTVKVRTSATTNILTTNVYDENFRKTSSTVGASTTWFHYDAVGNQDYVTDPRGTASGDARYTTYTDYDSRNRKWQVREPLSRTTQFYYDDGFNLTRISRGVGTPEAATETKAYDGLNRLKSDIMPQDPGVSILTQFQYNPSNGDSNDSGHSASLLKKVIDGQNHNTQFKYDAAGLKTQMIYHDGSSQSWAYDDAHNLKSRTTVAGEIQNFAYDNRNRKIKEWWDGWPADGEWRGFAYDDTSHLTQAANGTGADGTNFIAGVIRSYDDAGRLATEQQIVWVNGTPNTKTVIYPTYTDDGKVTRMYVNGATPAYDYTFSYDNMGRFEKIFATGNNNPFFQYHYDAASNETQRDSFFNGVSQVYPRDELNRMTKVELQGASAAAREFYDYYTIGRLRTVTRQDNKQDRFVYYLDGELKQVTYGVTATPPPSGTPAPPVATPATNVTSSGFSANWRSVAGATGYRLDVSTSITFANYVPGYQNLNVGNVTSRAVSGLTGSTTYYYRVRAYNGNGTSGNSNVISVITAAGGQVATPTFQPDGGDVEGCAYNYTYYVTVACATSGATIHYTLDGSTPTRNHGDTVANGGVVPVFVAARTTLKAMAYKTGMTDSNVHSADYYFHRDCGRQLPGYPLDNAGPPPAGPVEPDLGGTFTYTLDKAGNRTAVNGVNYSPNSINQYTSVAGTPITNGPDHQIQMHYVFTYTYMRDQELRRISATGLTFDVDYDALGRCVKRTANGAAIYYIYDGDKQILEYNANNGLVGFNVYGKGVDEIIERGARGADNLWHGYFLNQDHEGSVTHLTDVDGIIIEKYRYDAFGTPTIYNGGGTQINTTAYNNRFLFTGREYFGAWIYDYRARLYNSYLGRFMSEDPKLFDAGDYNLFRYCHNDPINHTDPMGLQDAVQTYSPRQTSQLKADEEYGKAMAAAQWANTRTNLQGSTMAAGMIGYQAWSAFRVLAQPISVNGRDPKGASGSVFTIQFRYSGNEEYEGYALSQDRSDATWDAKGNLKWSNFRPDTAHPLSNQQSTKHGITATDQAGKWELGRRPGSGVSSLNPVAHFNKFGQMMRTSAFGIGQDGSRAALGSHTWSAIYEEGHLPQYQGIGNWFPAVGH